MNTETYNWSISEYERLWCALSYLNGSSTSHFLLLKLMDYHGRANERTARARVVDVCSKSVCWTWKGCHTHELIADVILKTCSSSSLPKSQYRFRKGLWSPTPSRDVSGGRIISFLQECEATQPPVEGPISMNIEATLSGLLGYKIAHDVGREN